MIEPDFQKESAPIRVYVFVNNLTLRQVVVELLRRQRDLLVMGDQGSLDEALAEDWEVDIVLFDMDIPSALMTGAAAALQERFPGAHWVVLSPSGAYGYRERSRSLEAAGFVVKSRIMHDLIPSIYQAAHS